MRCTGACPKFDEETKKRRGCPANECIQTAYREGAAMMIDVLIRNFEQNAKRGAKHITMNKLIIALFDIKEEIMNIKWPEIKDLQ